MIGVVLPFWLAGAWCGECTNGGLELTGGPVVGDGFASEPAPFGVVVGHQQYASVRVAEFACVDEFLGVVGEIEQAEVVTDGHARFAESAAELLPREPEVFDQARVPAALLDRGEVL